ncbi:LOW QUALITY PROTEIN: brain tumor protein-like [Ctenocephalides felis]|uniref:LOW QUALITY PROTEIN: brain tumor protein-like n=1 Tax=Ctenocephalides felis TaxID=7515 RepID=UPI000E6E268B|nr:LOW QUALITY PROTEIN: brain tumor protein-like [Ctenocephalides felis]
MVKNQRIEILITIVILDFARVMSITIAMSKDLCSFRFMDAAQMKTGSRSGSLESLGEQLDSAQSAESLETSDNHLNHLNHHHLSNLGMLLGNIPNVPNVHFTRVDNLLNVNSQADQLFATSQTQQSDAKGYRCTGCKSRESDAVARCLDCANFLCPNCVMAHQFMHCFEGHRVLNVANLKDQDNSITGPLSESLSALGSRLLGAATNGSTVTCPRHKQQFTLFCQPCLVPTCVECANIGEHLSHEMTPLQEAGPRQLAELLRSAQQARDRAQDMRTQAARAEHAQLSCRTQQRKANDEINDTFQFYRSMLEERKQELLRELESVSASRQTALASLARTGTEAADRIQQVCDFVDKLTRRATVSEVLVFRKLLDQKLNSLSGIEFVSNYQAIQVGVRNTFGYIRSNSEPSSNQSQKKAPIARPVPSNLSTNNTSPSDTSSGTTSLNGSSGSLNGISHLNALNSLNSINSLHSSNTLTSSTGNSIIERSFATTIAPPTSVSNNPSSAIIISKRFNSANSLGPFSTTLSEVNPYEKWSNGGCERPPVPSTNNIMNGIESNSVLELTSKLMSASVFPPKSQIKRQKMIYHCKFGEFGVMEGQFTEPSGVAVNAQNDIIVADTNNHRIQIFDREGRFKFQFGECGKRDGQLLYPNRVAAVRTSGDVVVTERSPTHQIQIYNQYGQFVRKFGANILQHPRGVTVDNKGRIIVVECKVMRVIIFDQTGNVLQKFGCSKHLEFPNGVVVNDKQEIFISDNRAHCVKVFNYEGVYLRQIGGEGITNYPIGVGINAAGEILIADNHNNFNLTVFTQDGQLVSALESKVKHAQCFDVALMDDGSVVLASKDYRLYIYRYVQVPVLGL